MPSSDTDLKAARLAAGLTQGQVAVLAECSVAYVRQIEQGAVPTRGVVLDRIHAVLDAAPPRREPPPKGGARWTKRKIAVDAINAAITALDDDRPELARELLVRGRTKL